ncbi:hypothetical protein [Streptomyces sp. NBC_00316]|nr:hypothetical protein [Streptomyces sp. NBC_00316]
MLYSVDVVYLRCARHDERVAGGNDASHFGSNGDTRSSHVD